MEELQKEIGAAKSRISQEEFLQTSLAPWRELDLPLEETATESSEILLAAVPAIVAPEELERQQGAGPPSSPLTAFPAPREKTSPPAGAG